MKHRFEVLDIFRGIFATMVVLFHMGPFANTPILNNSFVESSDMFVDFFFVLSGFVISYTYQSIEDVSNLKLFLQKRLKRIYPLHVVMLLCFVFIETTKNYLSDYIHVNQPNNPNNSLFSFFTSLFLVNSIKMPGINDVSWNIPSWSISAEMIAYIIFSLCLLVISRYQFRKSIAFGVILVISLFTLVSVKRSFVLNYSFDFGFLRGIIGFFTGALTYILFSKLYPKVSIHKTGLFSALEIGILLVAIIMVYYGPVLKEVGLLYEVLFFTAILIFSFEKGILSKHLKKSSFLKKVGQYSYSIYLTHPLLLSLFNIFFIRILKFSPSAYSYLFILNLVIIYFFSAWTYRHIELRFVEKKKPKYPSIAVPVNS